MTLQQLLDAHTPNLTEAINAGPAGARAQRQIRYVEIGGIGCVEPLNPGVDALLVLIFYDYLAHLRAVNKGDARDDARALAMHLLQAGTWENADERVREAVRRATGTRQ